jgi:type IV secretory pathway component VirB8
VLCVALSLAIATLFPLKETKYKLYEFSSSGQTFRLIDDASTLVIFHKQYLMILFAQSETYRILFSYQLFLGKTHIDELKILSILACA